MRLPYWLADNKFFAATGLVALLVWVAVTMALHLHHETQTGVPVTGTVLSSSPFENTYQCGSVQTGNTSVPTYCTETDYHTLISVNDERARLDLDSSFAEGERISFWKIVSEDGSYSYGTMDPKSGGQLVLDLLLGFLAAILAGCIGMVAGMLLDLD